uniref:Mammalian ependymin-related protein 1 n=1 Tax=Arion vulgaris TaxID=1028688 RepID=A0A0B6ZEM9_9EUPU
MFAAAVIIFICSVLALSSACCTPDQWEGEEAIIGGYTGQRNRGILKEFVRVAYDAVNTRTAAFVDYRSGEHSNKFKIVTRYENGEGKLYVYDLKKDKCWTKTLDRPFRKACIPSEAKSIGSYYLGLKNGFKLTGYEFKGKRINAFVSVEEIGNECIPVTEAIYGRLNKVGIVQNIGFINISRGIRNTTIFDVPRKCEKKEDFSLAEELTRDNFIMAV